VRHTGAYEVIDYTRGGFADGKSSSTSSTLQGVGRCHGCAALWLLAVSS
jgi:hypothetical protein